MKYPYVLPVLKTHDAGNGTAQENRGHGWSAPADYIAGLIHRLKAATMDFAWADLPDNASILAVPILREAAAALTSQSAELLSLRRKVEEAEAALEKQRDDEDKAAREMQVVIQGLRNRATAAERKVEQLREAVEFAHAEGFNWPSDPLAGDKP